ncbi:hypothetical protein F5Y15DRAFT_376860 [Xylariaceae sp. FL0016]|nr:hypothetical protein F5Y15DRAFT_376860 [Xylariaceae sp. FL0016]
MADRPGFFGETFSLRKFLDRYWARFIVFICICVSIGLCVVALVRFSDHHSDFDGRKSFDDSLFSTAFEQSVALMAIVCCLWLPILRDRDRAIVIKRRVFHSVCTASVLAQVVAFVSYAFGAHGPGWQAYVGLNCLASDMATVAAFMLAGTY